MVYWLRLLLGWVMTVLWLLFLFNVLVDYRYRSDAIMLIVVVSYLQLCYYMDIVKDVLKDESVMNCERK